MLVVYLNGSTLSNPSHLMSLITRHGFGEGFLLPWILRFLILTENGPLHHHISGRKTLHVSYGYHLQSTLLLGSKLRVICSSVFYMLNPLLWADASVTMHHW